MIMACAFAAIAQCSDADKKALEAFDRAWGDAGLRGDKAALMAIYADDYMGLPGGQTKTAAIDGTMEAFEARKKNPNPDKVTYDNYFISCTPNSATITHRNTVWTADGEGGKPMTFWTRSVHTLEKRNGKWQVVGNAGNDVSEYDAIWYLEQDWNNAFWKRDKAWFDNRFAPDYNSISSMSGNMTGKAEDIAEMMSDKSTYDLVETTNTDIRIEGNTARVTGIFHLKGKDDKAQPFDRKIRYTDIWVKRDGKWVVWSSQGTMMK